MFINLLLFYIILILCTITVVKSEDSIIYESNEDDLPNWPKYTFDSSSNNLLTNKFSHFHCPNCNKAEIVANAVKTAVVEEVPKKLTEDTVSTVSESVISEQSKKDESDSNKSYSSIWIKLTPLLVLVFTLYFVNNMSQQIEMIRKIKSKIVNHKNTKEEDVIITTSNDDVDLSVDYLLKYKDFIEIVGKPDVRIKHDDHNQIAFDSESTDKCELNTNTTPEKIPDGDYLNPNSFYKPFWIYAYVYGEELAREYYGVLSPPPGSKPAPEVVHEISKEYYPINLYEDLNDNNQEESSEYKANNDIILHSYSKEDLEVQDIVSSFDYVNSDDSTILNTTGDSIYYNHISQETESIDPQAYYNDYWNYEKLYGEDAARQYYGEWSPPKGMRPPNELIESFNESSLTTDNNSFSPINYNTINNEVLTIEYANSSQNTSAVDPYEEFWIYASYYGESAARKAYADYAPPEGATPMYDYSLFFHTSSYINKYNNDNNNNVEINNQINDNNDSSSNNINNSSVDQNNYW